MSTGAVRPIPEHPVLIVEDEEAIARGYQTILFRAGLRKVICHTDSRAALEVIKQLPLSLVVLDLNMPHLTGEELLGQISELQPGVPVLVITGKDTVESAVNCIRKGAIDYLVKPVDADRILASVRSGLQLRMVQNENRLLNESFFTEELRHPEWFSDIVTRDPAMLNIFAYIEAVASSDSPVLITGETGVGKELVAKAIHTGSGRKGPFVAVNVAGLDDLMFSDTLFGHAKGSFTGASTDRQGLIARAAGGTVFLDEIGDISLPSQIKLLRLIQEQEYMPLGQDEAVRADTRFVMATNADLSEIQAAGRFRPDLYYRLSTHRIHVPPLRDRPGDLHLLVDHILTAAARKLNRKKPTPPKEILTLLSNYSFPGNVRELEGMLNDAVSRHTSRTLSLRHIRDHIESQTRQRKMAQTENGSEPLRFDGELPAFGEVKKLLVEEAMRRSKGNRSQAARLLKTTRQALSWYLDNPEK